MPRKRSIKKTKSKAKDMHPKSEPKKQKAMKKEKKQKQESFDILDTSSITFWKATTVVFALLFLVSIFTHGFSLADTTTGAPTVKPTAADTGSPASSASAAITPAGNAVKLDFYLMSQCPFGTQVADAIKPVLKKLGSSVDFNMYFIADDNGDGTFSSLHGQPEVDGDIVQLCAAKHNPDKYMDMIVCQNKNAGAIPGNWEQCAKDNGLDTEKIRACFEGGEGKELISASIKASEEVGATGSPTIYLNDEPYAGGRSENDFMRAICSAFEETKPDACSDIPACSKDSDCTAEPDKIGKCINPDEKDAKCEYTDPVKVVVTVLNDERCTICDTSGINKVTKNFFRGAEFKEVDYSTKEGKELYETYAIQYLPSFIFDNNIEKTATWTTNTGIQASFKKNDDGTYQLRAEVVGASFDPTAEICDNEIDDNGDGKTDCDDPDCQSEWKCMQKLEKPEVELFVMSHCPFGTQIEKGILPVLELLGDKIDYSIKFCTYAMHDKEELDEQTLQYCIQKDHKDKYIAYLKCFLKEGKTDECTEEAEIDKKALELCTKAADEQYKITESYNDKSTWLNGRFPIFDIDKESNEKYDIHGSPGFVVNGVIAQAGRDAASLLDAICTGFKDKPEECEEELPAETPSPGFGFEGTASAASSDGGCGA